MYWLIEQTNTCNIRCPGCPNPLHNRRGGFMDVETFRSIVDQLCERNPGVRNDRVALHGTGEPLLSPYFWMNLDYLERMGFRNVDFTSNGMIMDPVVVDRLVKYRCLSWVRISVNSSRRDVHEKINKGSDFDRVIANARYFVQKVMSIPGIFHPVIQLMKTRLNEDELPPELASLVGHDAPVAHNTLHDWIGLTPRDGIAFPFRYPQGCMYATHSIYFHWNGDMAGCCFDDTDSQLCGNARDGIFSKAALLKRGELSQELGARNFNRLPVCEKCVATST